MIVSATNWGAEQHVIITRSVARKGPLFEGAYEERPPAQEQKADEAKEEPETSEEEPEASEEEPKTWDENSDS